jgi:hypothetical protein
MHKLITQLPLGNIDGIGPLSVNAHAGPTSPSTQLDILISNVIGVLTLIAGIYFLIQLITSGYSWMSSGGDKQSVQTAQKKLTSSVLGLFIVVVAFALSGVIGNLLGLNIGFFGVTLDQLMP